MILLTKIKSIDVGTGAQSKDRKSIRDKANISNPKVNRGCAPLTANHTSADCVQISLGPSIPYIPLGIYHSWGLYAMQLKAANRRLPSPVRNGGKRQSPVIFTSRATLGPMLQTVMDPGTSLLVISCTSHRSPPQG